MADKTVKLYSVAEGKEVDFKVEVDRNGEIVASKGDEFVKFPAGMTKSQFTSEVSKFNKRHEGIVGIPEDQIRLQEENAEKSRKLIDSL